MSGEIPSAAPDPWPQLREQWETWEGQAVKAAIDDPKIQTMAGLLSSCTGFLTPSMLLDKIEEYAKDQYHLPDHCYTEVFMSAADAYMAREKELNGEA